jgi:hypothetical protein
MNAALGGVSAGGIGTPELDVTHIGGGPSAFVASQPGGNAGGVTLSKFSLNPTGSEHGGEHEGAGAGGSATTAEKPTRSQLCFSAAFAEAMAAKGEADPPPRSAMASEELIASNTAMPAAMNNSRQRIRRNRDGVDAGLRLVITDRRYPSGVLPKRVRDCQSFVRPPKNQRARSSVLWAAPRKLSG